MNFTNVLVGCQVANADTVKEAGVIFVVKIVLTYRLFWRTIYLDCIQSTQKWHSTGSVGAERSNTFLCVTVQL